MCEEAPARGLAEQIWVCVCVCVKLVRQANEGLRFGARLAGLEESSTKEPCHLIALLSPKSAAPLPFSPPTPFPARASQLSSSHFVPSAF